MGIDILSIFAPEMLISRQYVAPEMHTFGFKYAKIKIIFDMTKRKPIKLKHGYIKILARDCRCSRNTVTKALNWNADSDTENLIRRTAKDLGYIRQF